MADKVLAYRRDLMPAEAIAEIEAQRDHLNGMLTEKEQSARPETIQRAMSRLDAIMKPHGGDIYPVTFAGENVEMLLVAAILAIGIRTFFLQPFKIPTNSMWPTYAGMTEKVYSIDEAGPNALEKIWHFVTLGAVNYDEPAPVAGEVIIPFGIKTDEGWQALASYVPIKARKWLILPTQKLRYSLFVGGQPVSFEVPADFRLDEVIRQTYFPDYPTLQAAFEDAKRKGTLIEGSHGGIAIPTNHKLQAGQSVLDFDIDTGDMLFVDRFTYNFIPPKVGDPIVFRTNEIPGLVDKKTGAPAEQYYIKRLVGQAGDTLEVREPVLYRNGEPIEGADAFQKNSEQIEDYPGYKAMWRLSSGQTDTVPEGYVYAMGDNSPASYDSRGWGMGLPSALADKPNLNYVPEKEVIGEAFFIFYPFTHRWGLAD